MKHNHLTVFICNYLNTVSWNIAILKSRSSRGEIFSLLIVLTKFSVLLFLLYDENFSVLAYFDLHLLRTVELLSNDRNMAFSRSHQRAACFSVRSYSSAIKSYLEEMYTAELCLFVKDLMNTDTFSLSGISRRQMLQCRALFSARTEGL